MPEAIIFSDAHVRENDEKATARLVKFIDEVCPSAQRVFILGDLFDFWFGAKQANYDPYRRVLEALKRLAESGSEVVFYHGNRDFYFDEETAARYGMRLVRDSSVENLCGQSVMLCHGDSLCINDLSYHRMRRFLAHPVTVAALTRLPPFIARAMAKLYRAQSKRTTATKAKWVVGLDESAVRGQFARGVGKIVCGHTHVEETVCYETPDGPRELFKLADFGLERSYLECGAEGFRFRKIELM